MVKFFIDIVFDRYETLKLKIRIYCEPIKFLENYTYLRSNDFDCFFKNCSTDE